MRLLQIPYEVRRGLQRRLRDGRYESLRALARELAEQGFPITKSALWRHRQRLIAGLEIIW